ncbi:MAG: DNA repair protein RecN [Rickettsiales bacterium]|jgi:DNA repair protein RecN (Recombination protein N)|nr:DNA repair protein RecN [Rickettsiales bacterium]
MILRKLDIKNIVLIDDLTLEFHKGLNVMTGETGSGKSILMDALALSLGARSDVGLLRAGTESGQAISEFEGEVPAAVKAVLDENGIDAEKILTLRRKVESSGTSRAWVNGIPVNIGTLRQIGDALVEIHGQFENHSLMNPGTHIYALDKFGGLDAAREVVGGLFFAWKDAAAKLESFRAEVAKAASEREFLEHCRDELAELAPQPGEEGELAALRARLMAAEKNAATLADAAAALSGFGSYKPADEILFGAAHILERVKGDTNPYQKQIDRLYEIGSEISEIIASVQPIAADTAALESSEERLFALRAAARKHRVEVDELPAKLSEITAALESISNGEERLGELEREAAAAHEKFAKAAMALSAERREAAESLRAAIMAELPDLKLGQADIAMETTAGEPSASGIDAAIFMIKTNPGTPAAPLHKTASGGELARLMLALRVVLSRGDKSKTFVFDEVDTGISGATAAAVGERLAKLSAENQAVVITHSAQVAGFGHHHYLISKSSDKKSTRTDVREISGEERVNEVARILSGEKITSESTKNARQLIK